MKQKFTYLMAMLCLTALVLSAQPAIERPSIYSPVPSPYADQVRTEWRGEAPEAFIQENGLKKVIIDDDGGLEGPTHQVQIVIECDPTTQPPFEMDFRNTNHDSRYDSYYIYPLNNGTNTYVVPEGTFDIVAVYRQLNEDATALTGVLTVIREQVPIFSDTTLTFSADEAKNHITFQVYNIDGEPVNTGLWHQNEDGTFTCIEEGNTDEVNYYDYIACKDYPGVLFSPGPSQYGVRLDTQDYDKPLGEIKSGYYVNDVSDRIVFTSNRLASCYNSNDYYTSNYEVQGAKGDTIVSNDPAEFKLYSDSFDNHKDIGTMAYVQYWVERPSDTGGYCTSIRSPLSNDETINLYLGASPDKSCVSFTPMVIAGRSYQSGELPWGDPLFSETILSPMLTNKDGQAVIANNGASGRRGISFFWDYSEFVGIDGDRQQIPLYPTHPAFTYPVGMKKGEFGNNCPMLLTINSINDNSAYGGPVILTCDWSPAGRYGEIIPNYQIDMTAKKDGEIFYASTQTYVQLEEALHGDIDVELILDDILVDDIPASNSCCLHFNADAEDINAPTLTNLHFKDKEGYVTDRFENSEDGNIEFLAGDFGTAYTPLSYVYYTRFQPTTVEVSYSPYQSDDWNELAVEEVPEYYWPLLGWFYQSSLIDVSKPSENGWFDLRIKLVDEAGNWQEQTLSPAFRIDALVQSAVTEVRDGNAHEVARYSIDGKRVDTSHHGVTIIRMSDGTARKVLVP